MALFYAMRLPWFPPPLDFPSSQRVRHLYFTFLLTKAFSVQILSLPCFLSLWNNYSIAHLPLVVNMFFKEKIIYYRCPGKCDAPWHQAWSMGITAKDDPSMVRLSRRLRRVIRTVVIAYFGTPLVSGSHKYRSLVLRPSISLEQL